MNEQEINQMDAVLRSERAPGDSNTRLSRLLKRLGAESYAGKEISKGDPSRRAHRRSRASVKLSMASAVLAASLLLALGVGLGRVGTPVTATPTRPMAVTGEKGPSGPWIEALGRSRQLSTEKAEQLAKAGRASELASVGAFYNAMAIELVRESSDAPTSADRTESLLLLAESLQRDSSRFARLAAEVSIDCRDILTALAREASRQSARARELAG